MKITNANYTGQMAVRVFASAVAVPAVLRDLSKHEAASRHELKGGKVGIRMWKPKTDAERTALATGELITLYDMGPRLKVQAVSEIGR